MKRFGGRNWRGLFQGADLSPDKDNLRVNITKAVIETIVAKVGKARPRPTVLTDGADHALRLRAKKLQRYLDGVYQQAEVYPKGPLVFRDAMLGGTGVWGFHCDLGRRRPVAERVFPLEILVDPLDAINGDPTCLFRVMFIDRDRLAEMYPDKAAAIEGLKCEGYDELPDFLPPDPGAESRQVSRMIRCVQGWRLAGYTAAGELVPGAYVCAADNLTLAREDFDQDFFPFEFFHWSAPLRGFWGDAAATEIRGLETECNTLLQRTQKAMKLCGNPWVVSPTSANIKTAKISNEIGLNVKYDGTVPPTVVVHPTVHPQQLEQTWVLYAKAFEILGTNENQASATRPVGIESGRALSQLSEEHLVRFATPSMHWEDLLGRRFARQFVRLAKELDEYLDGGYVLRSVSNKTAIKVKWSECSMSPDDFFVQCFPTSILPHLPSGRTQEVERWQTNQWISANQAKQLLDFPDLAAVADICVADQELLDQQLEDILDNGKDDVLPEPRQDLQQAVHWGTYRLERAIHDKYPEDRLQALRTYLNGVDELLAAATPAPLPEPTLSPVGAPPPGMPVPGMAIPGMPPAVA